MPIELGPLHLRPAHVELAQAVEHRRPVVLALAKRREPDRSGVREAAARHAQQRRRGADLQERPIAVGVESSDRIGETHRLADVPAPVGGVRTSSPARPSGDVRDEPDTRRRKGHSAGDASNSSSIGSISGEWNACDTLSACHLDAASRSSSARARVDRVPVARRSTVFSGPLTAAIDDERAASPRDRGGELASRRRTPPPSRRRAAAPASVARGRRSAQGVLEAEHAGDARRHVLADAVPHHRGRLDAPATPQLAPARIRRRTAPAACTPSRRVARTRGPRRTSPSSNGRRARGSSNAAQRSSARGRSAACRRARAPCPDTARPVR